MNNCVDCDDCKFRCEDCLCEISDNEDDCPLANLSEFDDCVIGLTFDKTPILSYEKIILKISLAFSLTIKESEEFVDFNHIRLLDTYKTKPIIMYRI